MKCIIVYFIIIFGFEVICIIEKNIIVGGYFFDFIFCGFRL